MTKSEGVRVVSNYGLDLDENAIKSGPLLALRGRLIEHLNLDCCCRARLLHFIGFALLPVIC